MSRFHGLCIPKAPSFGRASIMAAMVSFRVAGRLFGVGSKQAATSAGVWMGRGSRRVGARERVAVTLAGASKGADGVDGGAVVVGTLAGIVVLGPVVPEAAICLGQGMQIRRF